MQPALGRPWLVRILRIVALLVVIWLSGSLAVTYRLTSRAERQRPEPVPQLPSINVEEHRLLTSDAEELGAWFLPQPGNQPILLLIHGNGDTRRGMLGQAEWLHSLGYPVLLLTVRAHGDSSGETNDFGYSARLDILAAYQWLQGHYPERKLIIWGRSLGSAAAVFAARDLGPNVIGYILECPYRDLATATRNRTKMVLPPVVEYAAYLGLRIAGAILLPDGDKISPVQAAQVMPAAVNVLLLAGSRDVHATVAEAESITEVLGNRAELVVIPGATHVQLHQADPQLVRNSIVRFLERCQP